MKKILRGYIACLFVFILAIAGAIAFGGPGNPPPMPSVNDPFKDVSFSDLPSLKQYTARDGTPLVYRTYPEMGAAHGSVVLVHGSAGSSSGMHVLAKAFAVAGYTTYALDVRGHGGSGEKGTIAYIGELEDDLEDFMNSVKLLRPVTLAGFSSGGGFVLRFAGSAKQISFSNYLLLSPFISQDAPTHRANSGGWVSVGVPRWYAIAFLDAFGVTVFDNLSVIRFALDPQGKSRLTPQYSFALAENFRPARDYRTNIRAVAQPMAVVAGANDEVFRSDQFEPLFRAEGKDIAVTLVPGIGHIPLLLEPVAVRAAVAAVTRMNESPG